MLFSSKTKTKTNNSIPQQLPNFGSLTLTTHWCGYMGLWYGCGVGVSECVRAPWKGLCRYCKYQYRFNKACTINQNKLELDFMYKL